MMVPTAKRKMQSFIQKHEGSPVINPHAPGSPPLQALTQTAARAPSPMIPLLDHQAAAEAVNFSTQVSKPSGLHAQLSLGPPRADALIERQRDDGPGATRGWESVSEGPHEKGGLREQWDEQSNINSLFSESEPARPASAQYSNRHGQYDDDSRSDIIDNRQPPRRGRHAHRSAESAPVFEYQNGQLVVPSLQGKVFNSSMITHAPDNPRTDAPRFRQHPFGSTSDEASPRPQRDPGFLRSQFPISGTEIKKTRRFEQPPLPKETSRRISPEKYSSAALKPNAYFQPAKELAQGAQRSTDFQNVGNPALDWDTDDSDFHSQGDEFPDQEQEHTPKAARQRVVPDDATMVLNPAKLAVAPKPQKTVKIQDEALLGSPIRQALLGPKLSPPKKRVRNIDYDEEALRKMNFAELQNEPFDHDPTRQVIMSPAKPPADNLDDRLEFYRSKDEDTQAQLFTQMSVREWDESGDWFLERFSNIVTRMREARQAKRKIVEQYETQISEREEEVRRKKENIDRKLSKLKHDSSAMLKGSQSGD
ncbi:hypothetical protein SLS63_001986 [Diaporthe eres]|uniref:Extracellular mutant protein 11 C-terminal domain-containing protein n=1 Tax=Diaporthe eres TaxID=83184 RepID=A0ABR1PJY0_DIAER